MDLHKKLLILIIVFTFLVRILFVFYSPLRGWDETVYLNLGRQLSEQPLNYSLQNSGWNDFIPADDPVYAWPNIGFRGAPFFLPPLFFFFFFFFFFFLFYLLLKEKSFKFLKDKYLWYGAGVFLLTLLPWLLYGFVYYDNPLGAFVHGFQASAYWGGVQPWTFFLQSAWLNFSVIASLFLLALFYVSFKKRWLRREIILLLAWVIFFFLVVSFMPHKENRFILPIVPAVCLLVGFLLSELKRFGNLILGFVGAILLISVAGVAAIYENKANDQATTCFWEANKFLANQEHNSLILTNQSPISYYYTRKENKLYPDPWKFDSLREELDKNYIGREGYFLYSNYDMPQESKIQDDLDDNLTKAFKCTKDRGYAAVYHL